MDTLCTTQMERRIYFGGRGGGWAGTMPGEVRAQFQASGCGISGEQSGTGTGFSPSIWVSPSYYHSTCTP